MTPTREQVLEAMDTAKTIKEIRAAKALRRAYLRVHPDDRGIFSYGEMLDMLESALKLLNTESRKGTSNAGD